MKKIILLLCVFFIIFPLWAEYYYQDDIEIFTLTHLSRRMGKVIPFTSFPVHGSDILDFAYFLESTSSKLNENEISMLENLIEKLEKQKDKGIIINGGLKAAYEHRLSTGQFMLGEIELPEAEDVRRAYLNFSPVLSIYSSGGTFNGIWISAQADFRPAWSDEFAPWSNFFTKADIAFDFLKRGILAWNGEYINASISRDTIHWGNPAGSTLYPAGWLPHMDSIRMNVPIGPFSLDYILATIMPKRARHKDLELGEGFGFMYFDNENPSTILFAAHRFQWNFGRLKVGAGSTMVYARANNQFLITDILPVSIFHNADSSPNNMALILDIEWTIFPGFGLSAMVGFDDIDAKIFGIPDGSTPTIPGVIIQLEYSMASKNVFHYYMLEAGYTHYLWGSFEYNDTSPDSWKGVHLARAIYRYNPNKYAVLLPLTSPYGPASLWGKFNTKFIFPQWNLKIEAEMLLLFKNSKVNLIDTPYEENNSLLSFDQWFFAIDIPVTYKWRNLEFLVCPTLLLGSEGYAFECTIGVRFTLEGSKVYEKYSPNRSSKRRSRAESSSE
ncbi:MAG: hypothetical protein FWD26_04730 [Treponema sp.]|nr:hypothetical protein [Treponema sp.]